MLAICKINKILIKDQTALRCLKIATENIKYYSSKENPFSKTWNLISRDIPIINSKNKSVILYPQHADIVIIGGGFIGSSVAYWLKTRAGEGLSVVVLEKDFSVSVDKNYKISKVLGHIKNEWMWKVEESSPYIWEPTDLYTNAQKCPSLGTITQHYSLPENIQLSQYSADFFRNSKDNLGDIDIHYHPKSYLVLACEKYAHKLEQNVIIQKELGVKNELITVDEIRRRYPWINTDGVKLGCIGTENEGTFSAYNFLKALIMKSKQLGTVYVNAEVTGFESELQRDFLMEGVTPGTFKRIMKVNYKTSDGEEHDIKFAACVLATGHESGDIASLANIGSGKGLLKPPLPIVKREFKVFSFEDKNKVTSLSTPYVMDTSGMWLKKSGLENTVLCGHVPLLEIDEKDLTDEQYLNEVIKTAMNNRFPDLKSDNITNHSTELHDYNTYDGSGILGPHVYHHNLYIATGFGMQGCTHAPGIGRAIAELIINSKYTTIDLTRYGFDRLLTDQPMVELNMY